MAAWNEKANEMFLKAIDIASADDRTRYLDQACAADSDLRASVETLLKAHAAAGTFLEAPAVDPAPDLDPSMLQLPSGTMIGRYKLLEPIGEGGYGVVFMAEQTTPVQRKVALKIIKAGMDTRQVIARFEAERQALALMDHPNIAKVFDAGATDSGRPYFVMELVKGVPITKYCDAHHIEPRHRLELFVQVCHAVQHAHQKGIIHRDIKPNNVLVAQYDGKPVPKVIDFGVAKATGQQLTERTMFTGFGDVIGTLEYMSPEQAEVNQLDVDTRSDIYSLGVLLYELLTGSTPLENKRIKQTALLEVLRFIREEDPPRPSTRLSSAEHLPSIAASRGLEPKKLSGLVRGELDWIVMKALEKDRTRRYETANGLAMDVQRYLADEAVQACPPSARYRFGKFARSHKVGLATGLALGISLLLAVAALLAHNTLLAREKDKKEAALARALHEKGRADQNLVRARTAVQQYLTRAAGNQRLKEADLHALRRDLLESAIPFYQEFVEQKQDDPDLEAERGRAYADLALVREQLGEMDQGLSAHQQRREIFKQLAARFPSKPLYRQELANAHRSLGLAYLDVSQYVKAEPEFLQAVALLEALTSEYPSEGSYRQDLAAALTNLGTLRRALGRHSEALDAQQKSVALAERLVTEFPATAEYRRSLAGNLSNLSAILHDLGQHDRSLTSCQRAGQLLGKLAEEFPTSPSFQEMWSRSLENQSVLLGEIGRRDEALIAQQQSLRIQEKLAADFQSVPDYRYELALSLMNLSLLESEMGRLEDGLGACDRGIKILERLAAEWPKVVAYQRMLARTYQSQGELRRRSNQLEEALVSGRQALSIQEKLAAGHPSVPQLREELALTNNSIAELQTQLGRYHEAAAVYQEALRIREALERDFPSVVEHAVNVGATYASIGDLQLAQEQRERAIEWYDKALAKLAPALASDPKRAAAQRHAGLIYINRAIALGDLNRHEEALKDLDRASALDEIDDRIALRLQRAQTMARLKMHAQATAEADAIAGSSDLSAQYCLEAAGVYAICAGQVREDAETSEKYAARAVVLLNRAIEKGGDDVAEGVAKDTNLEILRSREDFQKLIQESEKRQAKPATRPQE